MNRPTGVTATAVLTFSAASAAMILALGSCASFVVGVLIATGDERGAPISVAIAGMALAGAFLLLILAMAAGWLTLNVVEVRNWARTISFPESPRARERLRNAFSATGAVRRA